MTLYRQAPGRVDTIAYQVGSHCYDSANARKKKTDTTQPGIRERERERERER